MAGLAFQRPSKIRKIPVGAALLDLSNTVSHRCEIGLTKSQGIKYGTPSKSIVTIKQRLNKEHVRLTKKNRPSTRLCNFRKYLESSYLIPGRIVLLLERKNRRTVPYTTYYSGSDAPRLQ